MRVSEGGGPGPREAKGSPRSKRFGEALRTASRAARAGTALPEAGAAPPRAAATRRAAADRADDALRSRRNGFREEARAAEPPPPPAPARGPDPVATPELRALVRTLPLAIQTFGIRDGAPLSLSFGRSLDVELRAVPGGVELVLRPEPRLARASEAELRGVVAALGAKGISVARAEVRVRRSGGAGGPAPRVDVAAGLR